MGQAVELTTLWITREETVNIEVNGQKIERRTSLGISVKSDGSKKSPELYDIVDKVLNAMFIEEAERYLDKEVMENRLSEFNTKPKKGKKADVKQKE